MTQRALRTYSDGERAEAVALSLTIGADAAAKRLGIPRRNISRWRRTPTPVVAGVIEASAQDIARKLWEAVDAGTDAVLAGLRDPKGRLGDKANALRIVVEAHALLTGGPTARSESLNVNVVPGDTPEFRRSARAWLDELIAAPDDELVAWARDGVARIIRDALDEAEDVG